MSAKHKFKNGAHYLLSGGHNASLSVSKTRKHSSNHHNQLLQQKKGMNVSLWKKSFQQLRIPCLYPSIFDNIEGEKRTR